jgi:hypothetical protein
MRYGIGTEMGCAGRCGTIRNNFAPFLVTNEVEEARTKEQEIMKKSCGT